MGHALSLKVLIKYTIIPLKVTEAVFEETISLDNSFMISSELRVF